jgi:hypothetical protein
MAKKYNLIRIEKNEGTRERMRIIMGNFLTEVDEAHSRKMLTAFRNLKL